ncbi:MAG: DNA adenine methylase [Lachnospiraceae bacterium]|jgi:adenine-specific DNA-methyltransferase|nr:DNA adenine methylase [Lachnospiraceae bacterium]
MRYIGGKSLLLDRISQVIGENMGQADSVLDIFSGSAVVSDHFKRRGVRVVSNDFLYFCYVLARGTVGLNKRPSFARLGISDPIGYLNALCAGKEGADLSDCFIYQNYSPNETCDRMYFQKENALKIDRIRQKIEAWYREERINENGYYYLLAALLNAVPYVANITGVYAAYLKYWDARTYRSLMLTEPEIYSNQRRNRCCSEDYTALLRLRCDLLYADPPYNSREYLPNYHILETIARYDNPAISGVTGMRGYEEQKSAFCRKGTVYDAFERLVRDCKSRHILISYNNEGLLSTAELCEICTRYCVPGTFRLYEYDYRRYKNKIPNDTEGLKEQLYFLRRR